MEWAQGIEVMNGNLVARVADAAGERNLVHLGELSKRGLPDDRSTVRPLERFSLANLRAIDSDEYLQAFRLHRVASDPSMHSVYELRTERRRWIIPGLALIRGLFRPHKLVLEDAFRPNVVEATSFLDPSNGHVKLVAPWSTRVGGKANDPSTLLSWFWRDPAAMTLASSVHRLAMNGVIGIEPSDVLVDLAVNGLQRGTTFYATRCTTTRAYLPLTTAGTSPGQAEVLEFFECSSWRTAVQRPMEAQETVPRHRDGTLMTTDAEWAAVREILKGEGGHTPRVPVRRIFDAALLEQDGDRDAAALQRCGVNPRTVNYYRKEVAQSALFASGTGSAEGDADPHVSGDVATSPLGTPLGRLVERQALGSQDSGSVQALAASTLSEVPSPAWSQQSRQVQRLRCCRLR